MHIDIALRSNKGEVIQTNLVLDEDGEIQIQVLVNSKMMPVRLVLVNHILVVTAEPGLDASVTARWTGKLPRSTEWQSLPCRWDFSQQGWVCEVRQHVPVISADP